MSRLTDSLWAGLRAGSRPISPLHVNRSDSLEIGVIYLQ